MFNRHFLFNKEIWEKNWWGFRQHSPQILEISGCFSFYRRFGNMHFGNSDWQKSTCQTKWGIYQSLIFTSRNHLWIKVTKFSKLENYGKKIGRDQKWNWAPDKKKFNCQSMMHQNAQTFEIIYFVEKINHTLTIP